MYRLLISRRVAIYLLAAVLLALLCSALVPSVSSFSPQQWHDLEQKRPVLAWLYTRCSTPYLVRTLFFQLISSALCLSTLACTVDRVARWRRMRTLDFEKEKAFSFSAVYDTPGTLNTVADGALRLLTAGRWDISREEGTGPSCVICGQKGMSGFWGSVVFHLGLVLCFLAGPVTVLTGFSGELILTEGVALPLKSGIAPHEGYDLGAVPEAEVQVERLRGEFYQGQYRYDFGGDLAISDVSGKRRLPFAVNQPVTYRGYQFSLSEYGDAPRLVLERGGETAFDYYLNLRHPQQGDYFEVEPGVRAEVVFFPDFYRQGDRLGTRSRRPDNPVTLVRLYRGNREVFKGLFKPGEQAMWEGTRISVPDIRHWVSLTVVKEEGVLLVILASLLGGAGLLARFLSNERRIELELSPLDSGTRSTIRGYSRYYPAFLEREVQEMAQRLREGTQSPGPAAPHGKEA